MAKGVKTGGRQKGTPNKTTVAVKDALQQAFDGLGGVSALITWASENPTPFYQLYGKLLPLQVSGDPDNPIQHAHKIAFEVIKTE